MDDLKPFDCYPRISPELAGRLIETVIKAIEHLFMFGRLHLIKKSPMLLMPKKLFVGLKTLFLRQNVTVRND